MIGDYQGLVSQLPEDLNDGQHHWQGLIGANACLFRVEGIVVGDICLRLDVHPNGLLVSTRPTQQADGRQ